MSTTPDDETIAAVRAERVRQGVSPTLDGPDLAEFKATLLAALARKRERQAADGGRGRGGRVLNQSSPPERTERHDG